MTEPVTACEAHRIDLEVFDATVPVEPCDQPGTVDVVGYLLCPGCSTWLEACATLTPRLIERLYDEGIAGSDHG